MELKIRVHLFSVIHTGLLTIALNIFLIWVEVYKKCWKATNLIGGEKKTDVTTEAQIS